MDVFLYFSTSPKLIRNSRSHIYSSLRALTNKKESLFLILELVNVMHLVYMLRILEVVFYFDIHRSYAFFLLFLF